MIRVLRARGGDYLVNFFPSVIFPHVWAPTKHALANEYHIYIWRELPQLSCGDTHQIWMWCKTSNWYFCKNEHLAYGEMHELIFSNPRHWGGGHQINLHRSVIFANFPIVKTLVTYLVPYLTYLTGVLAAELVKNGSNSKNLTHVFAKSLISLMRKLSNGDSVTPTCTGPNKALQSIKVSKLYLTATLFEVIGKEHMDKAPANLWWTGGYKQDQT